MLGEDNNLNILGVLWFFLSEKAQVFLLIVTDAEAVSSLPAAPEVQTGTKIGNICDPCKSDELLNFTCWERRCLAMSLSRYFL